MPHVIGLGDCGHSFDIADICRADAINNAFQFGFRETVNPSAETVDSFFKCPIVF